jgi:glycolate oxidase iron-sulfur subunit
VPDLPDTAPDTAPLPDRPVHDHTGLHDHATLRERRHVLPVDEDELVACVACGLCLPHCPTYRTTGLETLSPRGRIAAMRAVELEGAPMDEAFTRSMETCVQCRGCEAACPSGVPFGRLMEGTRAAMHGHLPRGSGHLPRGNGHLPKTRSPLRRVAEWWGYVVVLPRHGLLVALTWLILVGQRLHVVPRRFGIPRLSARSLRTPLEVDGAPGETPDVYLFPGCVMDAWQRHVHRDALRVMRASGARPGLPGRGGDCCGALHVHAGRVNEARRLARRVMASMPGDAPIVVDSAGCGAAMKDYGHLVGTPEAVAFAARVRDFSEWLTARPPLPLRDTGRAAVVQDPCHLRHVQHAEAAVRRVLAPAYRLSDTADDGLCCGAGGAYSALEPALAGEIRDRKVAAIRAAARGTDSPRGDGASRDTGRGPLVVSANPGCAMHLAAAGLEVKHPAELLAAALDPRTEDTRA